MNTRRSDPSSAKPVIFQIAYDDKLSVVRTELLRRRGYEVVSVMGNDSAKVILTLPERYDLFIIGHAAPETTRNEMVRWLKEHYPNVLILALNSQSCDHLWGADYNVKQNGPEVLLATVANAVPPLTPSIRGGVGAGRQHTSKSVRRFLCAFSNFR